REVARPVIIHDAEDGRAIAAPVQRPEGTIERLGEDAGRGAVPAVYGNDGHAILAVRGEARLAAAQVGNALAVRAPVEVAIVGPAKGRELARRRAGRRGHHEDV